MRVNDEWDVVCLLFSIKTIGWDRAFFVFNSLIFAVSENKCRNACMTIEIYSFSSYYFGARIINDVQINHRINNYEVILYPQPSTTFFFFLKVNFPHFVFLKNIWDFYGCCIFSAFVFFFFLVVVANFVIVDSFILYGSGRRKEVEEVKWI